MTHEGSLLPGLDTLAPGVEGYTVDADGATYVPLVYATRPGQGEVGRWLDGLDRTRCWRFPNVLSPVLAGMLQRRGFRRTREWAAVYDEWVGVWERRAQRSTTPTSVGGFRAYDSVTETERGDG